MKILGRALVSTGIIGVVAVIGVCFRAGKWDWAEVKNLFTDYGGFLVVIFTAVVIWDFWSAKTKHGRTWDGDGEA